MENIFMIAMLICLVALPVGLIKPSTVIKWGAEDKRNRKSVLIYYGIGLVVSFILFGMTIDDVSETNAQSNESVKDTNKELTEEEPNEKSEEEKRLAEEEAKQKQEEEERRLAEEEAKKQEEEEKRLAEEEAKKQEEEEKRLAEEEAKKQEEEEKRLAEEEAKRQEEEKRLSQEANKKDPTKQDWNTSDTDIYENGNIYIAADVLSYHTQSSLEALVEMVDEREVLKAIWKYYGKVLQVYGEVSLVMAYPPGSDISESIAQGEECYEVHMVTDTGTSVGIFVVGDSSRVSEGDYISVAGMPIGMYENENMFGGIVNELILLGKLD